MGCGLDQSGSSSSAAKSKSSKTSLNDATIVAGFNWGKLKKVGAMKPDYLKQGWYGPLKAEEKDLIE